MIDPTYVSQAVAWLAVWAGGGLAAREYLARREYEQRPSAAPASDRRRVPAGKR